MPGDDRKKPTPPSGVRPHGRHQTQTERDVSGLAAKAIRERESHPIPPIIEDEVTGKYEGDELDARRAKRPTDERLKRLEDKHDALDAKVDVIAGDVQKINGELTHVPRLINLLERSLEQANATVTVTVNDQVAANKQRRDFWAQVGLKVLAGLGAIGIVILGVLQAQAQGCGR